MKLGFIIPAVFAATFAAGTASATPVTLNFNGGTSNGTAKITSPHLAPGISETVQAYGFNMEDTSGVLGSFVAWCLDISHTIAQGVGYTYEVTSTPFSNSFGLDAAQQSRVQNMFDANFGTLDYTNRQEAASFQVALWEVLYDDDYDISTGDFKATGSDLTKVADYLGLAQNYTGSKAYNLTFLESTGSPQRQNLVTASAVPVPAAGLLLFSALGGIAVMRRKRKAA